MALPSFAVTGNLNDIVGEVVVGQLSADALDQARIDFVPNFPQDQLIKWDGSMYRVLPVPARADTAGNVVSKEGDQLRLLANDDGLNVRNLQWQVRISIPAQVIPSTPSGTIRPWWIDAAGDGGNVDLYTTVPVAQTPYKIITQGPPGSTVNSVALDEFGRVVFFTDGTPIPAPLELVIYDMTDIDGGDAFGTGIIVIDGGGA